VGISSTKPAKAHKRHVTLAHSIHRTIPQKDRLVSRPTLVITSPIQDNGTKRLVTEVRSKIKPGSHCAMKPTLVILSMPLHNPFSNHVNLDLSRVSQANGDVYRRAVAITYQMALK
jgi:hypothetical protein